MHPRTSNKSHHSDKPRFVNPSQQERNWIRTIPDYYPDILRAPAVSYKAERDDPRIKANRYLTFARPYRGKQGLLLIGSEFRPIIIDESQPDRPNVMPMRMDRESLNGIWIFAITIFHTEGLIQIEDCIVSAGQELRSSKTFSERFAFIQRFSDLIWFSDKQFQLNWQLKIAEFFPLISIKQALQGLSGGNLCLMPESPTFRLLKVTYIKPDETPITNGPKEYVCVPIEGKPDVYDLADSSGTIIGRAAIQTLTISQALQLRRSTGQPLHVMAEWSQDFESYLVCSLI
uniref:Uncharacterized protein n=1 Tax=viral metagenome TaxID=1070528 RepID=A0A6C0APE7_9ZZZZ